MADPIRIPLTKDVWTKIATAISTGFVSIADKTPKYLQTYRETGNAAPTDNETGLPLSQPGAPIQSSGSIDVYIKPLGVDGAVILAQ